MPLILLAGTVSGSPQSHPFPPQGRPYASMTIDADDVLYRVIGHDEHIDAIECLQPGDAVSVQGKLCLSMIRVSWPGSTSWRAR
jgi:hypothetical protein